MLAWACLLPAVDTGAKLVVLAAFYDMVGGTFGVLIGLLLEILKTNRQLA